MHPQEVDPITGFPSMVHPAKVITAKLSKFLESKY